MGYGANHLMGHVPFSHSSPAPVPSPPNLRPARCRLGLLTGSPSTELRCGHRPAETGREGVTLIAHRNDFCAVELYILHNN